jgi:hypothetical protein
MTENGNESLLSEKDDQELSSNKMRVMHLTFTLVNKAIPAGSKLSLSVAIKWRRAWRRLFWEIY